MKKFVIFYFILISFSCGYAQNRVTPSNEILSKSEPYVAGKERLLNYKNENTPVKTRSLLWVEEETIGFTWYDLQTQASISTRIVNYEDNTIGAVFTYGMDYPNYPDRGTAYNYFNGESWQSFPDSALELQRTGWPAYQQFGENGEINVSHISGGDDEGLLFNKREVKFEGEWNEFLFQGPPGFEVILFPKLATGGVDHSVIHLLAQVQDPNVPYQGVLHPPVYSRSIDGGESWQVENELLNGLGLPDYNYFGFDQFNIVVKGENVAILYGDLRCDLGLLKSTDGGDSWEQTIIWEHPYPLNGVNPQPTDSFYCVDGSQHLAFDDEDMIHVVFGITRAYATQEGTFWFPAVDGIAYWNENRPLFSNDINALNPYGHPDSELVEDYSLIGWSQDLNNNGQLDILDDWGEYYLGLSSMSHVCFHEFYGIYVIYSSVTETYDNGAQSYRHLWVRHSPNNGEWWGSFIDVTNDLIHIFDECVFPSVAERVDDAIHLVYQLDTEPGLSVRGDNDPWGENMINYMRIPFYVGIEANQQTKMVEVLQNQPNPFDEYTTFYITSQKKELVNIKIADLSGKAVYRTRDYTLDSGLNEVQIDGTIIPKGVLLYAISTESQMFTGKMIKQ